MMNFNVFRFCGALRNYVSKYKPGKPAQYTGISGYSQNQGLAISFQVIVAQPQASLCLYCGSRRLPHRFYPLRLRY